jgi:hypothetical protein
MIRLVSILFILLFPANAMAATGFVSGVENPLPGQRIFQAKDNLGVSLDTIKIVESGDATDKYVGVYHQKATPENVYVATSPNLTTWTRRAELTPGLSSGSQPTIARYGGSFFVAYEESKLCPDGSTKRCIRVQNYPWLGALLSGTPYFDRTLHLLNDTSCEGTPNFFGTPNFTSIDIGFHYNINRCDAGFDRQSRGLLIGFGSTDQWSLHPVSQAGCDAKLSSLGAGGNHGDRDAGTYNGEDWRLYEAQGTSGDFSTWRNYATKDACVTMQKLNINTPGGSVAFANPTFTPLTLPNGRPGVVVTQFVPTEGNASSEVGELIYWFETDPPAPSPVIAASGDISSPCSAGGPPADAMATAALLAGSTNVLTLGDNQYDSGELANFNNCYHPTWGQYKSITKPSPGNHDPCTSGYGSYFPDPDCNYSYDVGSWHLVSLNSNSFSSANTFLQSDVPNFKQCTLAYWHHPRFNSGASHGNNTSAGVLWTTLLNANADVVLNGHEHTYERFAKQNGSGVASATGIREFVSGLGGHTRYSFGTPQPNSEFRYNAADGVLKLTLKSGSYDWQFVRTGGSIIDSGSDNCV